MATNMSTTLINTIFAELCDKAGKAKSIKLDVLKTTLEELKVDPSILPIKIVSDDKDATEDKKTKGKRRSKKDPNAPKKEPTTYNLFVKAFINKHRDEYDDHKLRFAAASKAWTNTSDDDDARETLLKEYGVISNGSEKKEPKETKETKKTEKKNKKKTEKKDIDTPPVSPIARVSSQGSSGSPRRLQFRIDDSDENNSDDDE